MRDDVLGRSTSSTCSPSRSCASPIVGGPNGGDAMTDASDAGVDRRGARRRSTRAHSDRVTRVQSRSPVPARCVSTSRRAGCAVPISTSPREISRRGRGVVPGHEIVGRVDALRCRRGAIRASVTGSGSRGCATPAAFAGGAARGAENLCVAPKFTGWDADGGYAPWAVVDERYTYALPDRYDDEHAAPLLCRGHRRLPRVATGGAPTRRPARDLRLRRRARASRRAGREPKQGATVHVLTPDREMHSNWPSISVPPRRARPTPAHPSHSMPQSCSHPPVGSYRSRSRHSVGAARSRSQAST